jgi:hypothetical protein
MKMNVFEYTITDGKNDIAGCEDIDLAKGIAYHLAEEKHCDIDVINAFTGEVVYSLECYIHLTLHHNRQMDKSYEIKERVW